MDQLLRHAVEHGVPIAFTQVIDKEERDEAILYVTHTFTHKEAEFNHTELSDEVQAGHVTVFPLEKVAFLKNLWLSPVAVIPKVVRRPRLIYDFTWSGLNETTKSLVPIDAMCIGSALQRTLKRVLTADLHLGKFYLSKVNLADVYMRLGVIIEDIPSISFLIPSSITSEKQLVGFHLSLSMGYIASTPYFCMAVETVTDFANDTIAQREQAG